MQTFLPPSNPPSYHLLPHPGGSQNGCQNYQYSDSMDPGPSDASLRTFHGRTMSYDTNSSSEGLNQNGGSADCVVWPQNTSANKTLRNTNLLTSARVTPNLILFFLLIHKSFGVIHTFLKGVLKDSTKKTPFNIIAKLFMRVISEVKFSADWDNFKKTELDNWSEEISGDKWLKLFQPAETRGRNADSPVKSLSAPRRMPAHLFTPL